DRGISARAIFSPPPTGKSVLDIGCNYGYFTHEAVQYGAREAVGLERNPELAEVARTVAEIKGGPVRIVEGTLETANFSEPFDWVLVLNVIHHIPDPFQFMRMVAGLARERVVVEFPMPSAGRFRDASRVSRFLARRLNLLPIIGVRPEAGTRFYFTPTSFEATFVRNLGLFRRVECAPSPAWPDRSLAFCEI
ncbi:MAG: class I SAM-dependent methyltransferase, partial [Armatimonadetes bacterium]|nr:class I SAM-dependent methyltransferase [Armatimonadota bacterium]